MGSRGSPPPTRLSVRSVCIIGAGPSGLAAAKYAFGLVMLDGYLAAEAAFEHIVVFEQRAVSGGLWNYVPWVHEREQLSVPQTTPHTGHNQPVWAQANHDGTATARTTRDEASFVTPVYERLETNIPRDLMGFSDLPWPDQCQLFPKHEQVLEYIRLYAVDVQHLIAFNTQVLDVRKTDTGQWAVQTQKIRRDGPSQVHVDSFDAVVVANGHYDVPYVPSVKGIDEWNEMHPGTISHSKFYRRPEEYSGKKVIVVGNSASGIDIGAQIATVCQQPLLQSQKSESYLQTGDAPQHQKKPQIVEYISHQRSVRFEDGTIETDVDDVLYCTGYFYSYPFLSSLDPPLITTGERVEHTYQHIFYRSDPTLALLVLNQKAIPFPVAEAQSAVVARVFSGRLPIPSPREMQLWEDGQIADMGNGKSFHVLSFPRDANYINMLHDWAVSADGNEKNRTATLNSKASGSASKGRPPPYWGEKSYWTRERFPAIKKAFQDFGKDRQQKRTLEDVGYDFESWKIERT